MTEIEIEEARAWTREMFEVAYQRKTWKQFEPILLTAREKPWAKFLQLPASEADLAWWRRNEFDPAETLRKLRCPVLAMFGADDPLVPPASNVPL